MRESDGRWVLGLDMEIMGCLPAVGDVGDGERVASRLCPPVFTSFEKKLGGMARTRRSVTALWSAPSSRLRSEAVYRRTD